MLRFLFRAIAAVLLVPLPAWAYIDSGSGLVLWQGLIAALGAGLLFIRHPVQNFKRFLRYLSDLVKK